MARACQSLRQRGVSQSRSRCRPGWLGKPACWTIDWTQSSDPNAILLRFTSGRRSVTVEYSVVSCWADRSMDAVSCCFPGKGPWKCHAVKCLCLQPGQDRSGTFPEPLVPGTCIGPPGGVQLSPESQGGKSGRQRQHSPAASASFCRCSNRPRGPAALIAIAKSASRLSCPKRRAVRC